MGSLDRSDPYGLPPLVGRPFDDRIRRRLSDGIGARRDLLEHSLFRKGWTMGLALRRVSLGPFLSESHGVLDFASCHCEPVFASYSVHAKLTHCLAAAKRPVSVCVCTLRKSHVFLFLPLHRKGALRRKESGQLHRWPAGA